MDAINLINCKADFVTKLYGNKALTNRISILYITISEPLSEVKNYGFNMFIGFLAYICHLGSPRKLTSIDCSLVLCCVGSLA